LLGKEFMPQLAGGRDHVPRHRHPVDLAGRVDAGVQAVDATLRKKYPQVRSVLATIGRAEKGETADVNYMEVLLDMKPQAEWPRRDLLGAGIADAGGPGEGRPDAVFGATQPIQMRVEELISGVRATLALKLYGEDLDNAGPPDGASQERLEKVPGVTDLSAEANKGKPQLVIKVNREAASRYGINADEILRGRAGRHWRQRGVDADRRHQALRHRGTPGRRSSGPIRRRSAPSRSAPPKERSCPSRRWRRIELDEGYSFVRREALQRYAVLQMDVKGRDVDSFVKEADAAQGRCSCRPATGSSGAAPSRTSSAPWPRLALIVPLTIGLIFILLYTAFNSVRHATIIIANVPFAIIGGIIGLFVTGQYLSVPSAIGFIAVFGVAMLNGIVLVSFLNDQRRHGLSSARRCGKARAAAAAGADDGVGGHPRLDPHAAVHRCRRRDAAAAGHRGGRRTDHLDGADAAAAAPDLRVVGS
jgi:cobalt-zinc-cadmium resistance protein CzcA